MPGPARTGRRGEPQTTPCLDPISQKVALSCLENAMARPYD